MAIESVAIDSHVWAREGKPVGRVTRFVVAPATGHLDALVVDRGPLSTERLVDVALVDRSAHDEVFLTVDDDEAGRLPPFVKREVAQVRESPLPPEQSVTFDSVAGFAWDPYEGEGVADPRDDSLFETVPTGTVVTDTISSVPEDSVVLTHHTKVVSADGFTAGHLQGLELDDQQRVAGVVMTSGHLYKHHVRVPMTSVADLTHDRIKLTQGLDEAMDTVNEADIQPA
jgi:hypothetical protein